MKVAVITLGCDKNTVDSERYLAQLADRGAEPTADAADADVIVVNTCGFIDAAKQESIDALVEAGRLKEQGSCRAVVAVGCMVQRHEDELRQALPEVDLFLGASEMDRLLPELESLGLIDDRPVVHPGVRLFTGELPHVRYLKISEGCDHGCAFCAIPLMRGRHRSFALDEVVREAQLLEAQGAREINLVAQDLAHYGRDLRGTAVSLPDLLEALLRETSVPWIRMLYLYSAGLTPRLLELMARESRILPYLDMPIQHGSDEMLRRMRRPERQRTLREKVTRIRDVIPDAAIRTTCVVGFPGETEADFETLLAFLDDVQFDRAGAFAYSPQEGTRGAELPDDVPEPLKRERLERLLELQRQISVDCAERHVGRTVRAIVDRVADDGAVKARTMWQADEVDGVTLLAGAAELRPGTLADVTIRGVADDADFVASVARVAATARLPARRMRHLPVAPVTIGSFGR
ncbi:MAG: 30S ribosomal protein S12 methylthiotransferase RimO [Gemmatimonadaceae bacterium]